MNALLCCAASLCALLAPPDFFSPYREEPAPKEILIRGPAEGAEAVDYMLNGRWRFSIRPGETQKLDPSRQWRIQYQPKPGADSVTYSLPEGFEYRFDVTKGSSQLLKHSLGRRERMGYSTPAPYGAEGGHYNWGHDSGGGSSGETPRSFPVPKDDPAPPDSPIMGVPDPVELRTAPGKE